MLNKAQHSSLGITLRLIEEAMKEIEALLAKGEYKGILYAVYDDLSEDQGEALRVKVDAVWAIVKNLAGRFQLKPRKRRRVGRYSANFHTFGKSCWRRNRMICIDTGPWRRD